MSSLQMEPGAIFAGQFHVQRLMHLNSESARYEVTDGKDGPRRCLKVLTAELVKDATLRQRFVDHLKSTAAVTGPSVLPVLDAGVEAGSGLLWYVTELLAGRNLEEILKQQSLLPKEDAVRILGQIGEALSAVHRAGLVHGSLKPKNIFVVEQPPDQPQAKLLNLGVNTALTEAKPASAAAQGTPMWMAPEQAVAGEVLRAAVDVWAYGLLAFRLLSGHVYWREANKRPVSSLAVMREVSIAPLEPASNRAREYDPQQALPEGIDAWFAACVHRDSSMRYATVTEASQALLEVLAGRPPRLPPALSKPAPDAKPGEPDPAPPKEPKQSGGPTEAERDHNARRRPTPPAAVSVRPPRRWRWAGLLSLAVILIGVVGHRLWSRYQRQQQQRLCDAPATERDDLLRRFIACQESCSVGHADHCLQAGRLVLQHKLVNVQSAREAARSYEQACQLGRISGCRQLAMMYWDGNEGVSKDRPKSIALLLQACQGEDAEACAQLTEVEIDQIKQPQDQSRLVALLERACQKKEVASCAQLGQLYLKRKDFVRAFDHFERACSEGDAASCATAGHLALGEASSSAVVGVGRNVKKASELFRHACDKELSVACFSLGQLYARGEGMPRNPTAASQIYRLDCSRGGADSCHALALLHLNGHGVERDRRMGMDLLKRACELGHRASCETELPSVKPERLGSKDKERPASDEQALRLLDGCQAGSGDSCYRVAAMFEHGQGLPKDPKRARALYLMACQRNILEGCQAAYRLQVAAPLPELGPKVSCNLDEQCSPEEGSGVAVRTRTCGNAQSCKNMGDMYFRGQDVRQDLARAAEAYQQACDLGHGKACVRIAEMYERGEGVAKDAKRAAELHRKGCAIGAGVGCERFEQPGATAPNVIHL